MGRTHGLTVLALILTCQIPAAESVQTRVAKLKQLMKTSPAAEMHDVYTGPVDVSVMDDFDHGTSTTVYEFRHQGIRVSAYQASVDAPAIQCGDVVRLEGMRLGDTMAINRASVTGRQAGGEGCSSVGQQDVAVILVSFPGVNPLPTTIAAIDPLLFHPSYVSSNRWYQERSYGKVSLAGKVFGPYMLDRAYNCEQAGEMQAAAIRAADRDIDFTQFRRYMLIFPTSIDCWFSGMGTLGCRDLQSNDGSVRASWTWINYRSNHRSMLNTINHELGHNLGLTHSRLLRFPEDAVGADDYRGAAVEYGDRIAVMGSGIFGDFAARHKVEMGWLDPSSDVLNVERDGDFVIAPLGNQSGVRALRVRRRVGSDEWLWLEYRLRDDAVRAMIPETTGSGYDGVVVRRETPESGLSTHLIDMTPATLDQARGDLGVFSEWYPELQPGKTWSDPHSELTISAGAASPDGIAISVRYDERCATPGLEDLTVRAEQQSVFVPVAAGPECLWTARSGRSWIGVSKAEGGVLLSFDALAEYANRSGVVSIGRKVVRVRQLGPARDMTIVSLSPPDTAITIDGWVPFAANLRDENGLDDMPAIQVSVLPRSGSSATPCYFRYAVARKIVEFSEDGTVYRDHELGTTGYSGACGLQPTIVVASETEMIFRFALLFAGQDGEALTLSLRSEDASGAAGPWLQAAELTATRQCRALPTSSRMWYFPNGASGYVPVLASSSPCAWTATTDVDWIHLKESSSSDGGTLGFDVDRNSGPQSRDGNIVINGTSVRVTQFGNGEINADYVTLLPKETVVSSLSGIGAVYFRYSLAPLVPAVSGSDWLRVTKVARNGDEKYVLYEFDTNPDTAPRLGTLVVGGRTFTVLQQGSASR